MANTRRMARVASQVKREIAQMLLSGIKDDRVGTGMVSVTAVEVSGDLQHAKVFVSIYGSDLAKAQTMAGLEDSVGFVRHQLSQRLRLRRAPEIIFFEDDSLEQGDRMIHFLEQLERDRPASVDSVEPYTTG